MNLIHKSIDKYEEIYEKFLIPIIKTDVNLVKENEYINPLLKLQNEFIKNKINLSFNNLNLQTEKEKLNFINNLETDNEKVFFMETINKIIDLDDSLQNYMMSYLTEQFTKNKDLDYYEKKLYYNIKTLSEDDSQIYYCLYKVWIIQSRYKHIETQQFEKSEIINISLNRFVNIGLLKNTINY